VATLLTAMSCYRADCKCLCVG